MPRKRVRGLGWLNRRDADQIFWAANYLRDRRKELRPYSRHLDVEEYGYDDLIAIGEDLERKIESGGSEARSIEKLLQDMKAAARGAKARKKQRESGARKVVISGKAGKQLAALAASQKMSEGSLLEKLIERSFKAKTRASKRTGHKVRPLEPLNQGVSLEEIKSFLGGEGLRTGHQEIDPSDLPLQPDGNEYDAAGAITPLVASNDLAKLESDDDGVAGLPPNTPPIPVVQLAEDSNSLPPVDTNDQLLSKTGQRPNSSAQSTIINAMRDMKKVKS